jgi:hypothetical protein
MLVEIGRLRELTGLGLKITLSTTSRWSFGMSFASTDFPPPGRSMMPLPDSPGTTAVGSENASPEPRLFLAMILTRRRLAASACTTLYVFAVFPVALHAFPSPSQRSQPYEYVIGSSPTHLPVLAVSVAPTTAVPLIVGAEEFAGFPPSVVTTDVAAEVPVDFPCLLLADTRKRMRSPRSCCVTM